MVAFNEESAIYKGEMTKDITKMSLLERDIWRNEVAIKTKKYLFSIGQPLVYRREDGSVIAEYADGKIEIIR